MAKARRGRNEGGVYQRASDGKWVGSVSDGFHPDGRRRRVVVYGRTKAIAQQKLRAKLGQKDAGTLAEPGGPTVGAWLDRWVVVVAPTVEPGTLRPYKTHCRLHIKTKAIARVKLAKLRVAHVEEFFAELLAAEVSPAMARKVGTTLAVALNHAVRSGLVAGNPVLSVKKPKADKPDIEILSPDEARAFAAAAAGHRYGPLLLLLLDTGLRPGEAFALTWADIDLGRPAVRVTKSLEEIDGVTRLKKPKTKRSVRSVDLAPGTAAALAAHKAAAAAAGLAAAPAFCNAVGGHLLLSNVHRDGLRPVLAAAGLKPVSLYALRHTTATLLLMGGMNPKVVSERLGHSTTQLTMDTYSHVLPTMQAAAGVIGAALYGDG